MPYCEISIFHHSVTQCWNNLQCKHCILWYLCWSIEKMDSYYFIDFEEALKDGPTVFCNTAKFWSESIQSWLTKLYQSLRNRAVLRLSHWPCRNCCLFRHELSNGVRIQLEPRCRGHWSSLPSKAYLCSSRSQREYWASFDCFFWGERTSFSSEVGFTSLSFVLQFLGFLLKSLYFQYQDLIILSQSMFDLWSLPAAQDALRTHSKAASVHHWKFPFLSSLPS